MNCEMCGTEDSLVAALVEGVELKVCKNCASYGKLVKKPVVRAAKSSYKPQATGKEVIQVIKEDFAKIIREKREKMGLKQSEFAKFLAERESLVHQIENGSYTPSIELARKLEKQLSIVLVEQKEIAPQSMKAKSEEFTIGDIIKLK